MQQTLFLNQIIAISEIIGKTKWTKDLNIEKGNRIEIKMPLISTVKSGASSNGVYASELQLKNLDKVDAPVKYTTVNNFLNIFPQNYLFN